MSFCASRIARFVGGDEATVFGTAALGASVLTLDRQVRACSCAKAICCGVIFTASASRSAAAALVSPARPPGSAMCAPARSPAERPGPSRRPDRAPASPGRHPFARPPPIGSAPRAYCLACHASLSPPRNRPRRPSPHNNSAARQGKRLPGRNTGHGVVPSLPGGRRAEYIRRPEMATRNREGDFRPRQWTCCADAGMARCEADAGAPTRSTFGGIGRRERLG